MNTEIIVALIVCGTLILIATIAAAAWATVNGYGKAVANVAESLFGFLSLCALLAYCNWPQH